LRLSSLRPAPVRVSTGAATCPQSSWLASQWPVRQSGSRQFGSGFCAS